MTNLAVGGTPPHRYDNLHPALTSPHPRQRVGAAWVDFFAICTGLRRLVRIAADFYPRVICKKLTSRRRPVSRPTGSSSAAGLARTRLERR